MQREMRRTLRYTFFMAALNIPELLKIVMENGTDLWNIEVKRARTELPDSLDETLCAFANMPEGGTILLGLSEDDGQVSISGVTQPQKMMSALGHKARNAVQPPIQLGAMESASIDGKNVIACIVPPQPSEHRPFRTARAGRAFTRSGDGDHELSEQEENYLLSQRQQPMHDRLPVPGADPDHDLASELVEKYLATLQLESSRFARLTHDEQLIRANIVDHETGQPTVAAVYALGIYPQQFLPQTVVKAHARNETAPHSDGTVRLSDRAEFAGPLPDLLTATTAWVQKQLRHAVVIRDGDGYNAPELPPVAIREVVANALVHRDLSPASFGTFPMVIKTPSRLIIESPGGLWGLTTRELGKTSPRARNAVLYRMCSAITTPDGRRVVEGHATGIPAVISSLNDAFLPAPYFVDEVVKFKVILSSSTLLNQADITWLNGLTGANALSVAQKHALIAMRNGEEVSNSTYRSRFPMDSVQARAELQQLAQYGLAQSHGSGRGVVYTLQRPTAQLTASQEDHAVDAQDPSLTRNGRILEALKTARVPLNKKELIERTSLSPAVLSRALTSLSKKGALHQSKDPADKRVTVYSIAPSA